MTMRSSAQEPQIQDLPQELIRPGLQALIVRPAYKGLKVEFQGLLLTLSFTTSNPLGGPDPWSQILLSYQGEEPGRQDGAPWRCWFLDQHHGVRHVGDWDGKELDALFNAALGELRSWEGAAWPRWEDAECAEAAEAWDAWAAEP